MNQAGPLTEGQVKIYSGGAADVREITFLSIINKGLTDISVLSLMTNLISVDLSKNSITSIAALAPCPHLRYLKLSFNSLGNSTFKELVSFVSLPTMRVIDLSHNQFEGEEARKSFVSVLLPNMSELRSLSIDHCPFAMDGSSKTSVDGSFMSSIVETAVGLTTLNGVRVRTLSGFVMDSIADSEGVNSNEAEWRANSEKLMEEVTKGAPDIGKWLDEDGVSAVIARLPGGENSLELTEADDLMKRITETTRAIQSFLDSTKQQKE